MRHQSQPKGRNVQRKRTHKPSLPQSCLPAGCAANPATDTAHDPHAPLPTMGIRPKTERASRSRTDDSAAQAPHWPRPPPPILPLQARRWGPRARPHRFWAQTKRLVLPTTLACYPKDTKRSCCACFLCCAPRRRIVERAGAGSTAEPTQRADNTYTGRRARRGTQSNQGQANNTTARGRAHLHIERPDPLIFIPPSVPRPCGPFRYMVPVSLVRSFDVLPFLYMLELVTDPLVIRDDHHRCVGNCERSCNCIGFCSRRRLHPADHRD